MHLFPYEKTAPFFKRYSIHKVTQTNALFSYFRFYIRESKRESKQDFAGHAEKQGCVRVCFTAIGSFMKHRKYSHQYEYLYKWLEFPNSLFFILFSHIILRLPTKTVV